jgi:hypothetical protein
LFHHRSTGLDIHRRDGQSRGTEGGFFLTSTTDNDQLSAFASLKRKKPAKVDLSQDRGNTEEISTVTVATAGESVGGSARLSKLRPLRELTARKRTIIDAEFIGGKLLVKFEFEQRNPKPKLRFRHQRIRKLAQLTSLSTGMYSSREMPSFRSLDINVVRFTPSRNAAPR